MFGRYGISLRAATNTKSQTVEQRLLEVRKFHRIVREFARTPPLRDLKHGRFPARDRFHADQVPLEFGGVFSKTAAPKGSKRVHVKSSKHDMARRQATIQLTFNAEEKCSVKPGICFRLAPQVTRGKVNPQIVWLHSSEKRIQRIARRLSRRQHLLSEKGVV